MKKDTKKKDVKKPVGVAMTDSLKARVQAAAEKDGRSVSDYVCRVLEQSV
ncbi:MAG: hypothetical protein GY861_03925 [bacterium]|nr:hypothetical protein [bacterium]